MYNPDSTTTNRNECEPCNACGGKGYQMNIQTGINEQCPVCGGTGIKFTGKYIITS